VSLLRKNDFRVVDKDGNIYLRDTGESLTSNESRRIVLSNTSGNSNEIYYSDNMNASGGDDLTYYGIPDFNTYYNYPSPYGTVIEADAAVALVESDNRRASIFFDVNNGDIANFGDIRSNGFHIADKYYVSNGNKVTWQATDLRSETQASYATVAGGSIKHAPTDFTNIMPHASTDKTTKEWRFKQYLISPSMIQMGSTSNGYNPILQFRRVDPSNASAVVESPVMEGIVSNRSKISNSSSYDGFESLQRAASLPIATYGQLGVPNQQYNFINLDCRVKIKSERWLNYSALGQQNLYHAFVEIDISLMCERLIYSGGWGGSLTYARNLRFDGAAIVTNANSSYSSLTDYPIACELDPNITGSTSDWDTEQTWHVGT
jgi:hypothetical protein